MPTYTYETMPTSGEAPRRFEVVQKMSDPPLTHDPETDLPVRRVITGGSVIFGGPSTMAINTRKGPKR